MALSFLTLGQWSDTYFTDLQIEQVGGAEVHREMVWPTFLQWLQREGSQGLETLILVISPFSN